MKHTPSPWIVDETNRNGYRCIHSIHSSFAASYVGEALEHDAQLIAAAPDLLKALSVFANITPTQWDQWYGDGGEAIRQARAAIAKATA